MTRSHSRLAAAAAAVLALGLATASPALADPGNGKGNPNPGGQGNGHANSSEPAAPAPAAPSTTPAAPAPAAPPAGDAQQGPADKGGDQGQPADKPGKPAPAAKPSKPGKPAPAAKGADPRGNNGTVKIAPYGPVDRIPNNTPHVGCTFQVEWFGFDEGSDIVSQVVFAEHAPTLGSGMSVDGPAQVFVGGDSASGAGTDSGFDGVAVYTLSFTGEPHPQQGYHVKLTIHTPGSQGADVKHKVFWVEGCAPTPPVTEPGTPVTEPGTPVTEPGTPVTAPGNPVPTPHAPVAAPSTPVAAPAEAAPQVLAEEAADATSSIDTTSTQASAAEIAENNTTVMGAQATKAPGSRSGVQLPLAIDAGADAIGMETPTERSLLGLLLMLLGAVVGRVMWTRRARA